MTRRRIVDPWRVAESAPARPAVIAADSSCSFGELIHDADLMQRGLDSRDLPDGSVIGTDLPPGPRLFALTLAALRGGYGILPVDRRFPPLARRSLLNGATAALDVVAGDARAGGAPAVPVEDLLDAGRIAGGLPPVRPAGFIAYVTSGTTGEPTVVRRRRPWYRYRGVAVDPYYASGPESGPHVMCSPTFHFGTLGPALYALQAGSAIVVPADWSPDTFAQVVDRYKADSAFLTVDQLGDLAAAGTRPRRVPARVFHAGSAVPTRVKHAAIRLLGPVLHEFYGTSQGLISEVSSTEWLTRPGTVGRPLPGVRVRIQADGSAVPAGSPGQVHVEHRPVETEELEPERTGDTGYLDEDGFLYLLGRAPASQTSVLEHLVRELPQVRDVAIIGGRGVTRCCLEVEGDMARSAEQDLDRTVRRLAIKAGIELTDVVVEATGALPRTWTGKLRHVGPAVGRSREG
jgi:long-chain acyl-CoA synthetase